VYTVAFEAQAHLGERLRVLRAIETINSAEILDNNELRYITDPGNREIVVVVVDRTTGEVLRRLPVTRVLQLMAGLASGSATPRRPG
jgi:uncharacterized FlaG/YvyC family protein